MRGFLIFDHARHLTPVPLGGFGALVAAGKIRYEETVMDGIDKAVDAFLALFSGEIQAR